MLLGHDSTRVCCRKRDQSRIGSWMEHKRRAAYPSSEVSRNTPKSSAMGSVTSPSEDITSQWQHPSDIFSLLLLVGGDVVQKALTRLTSVRFRAFGVHLCLTPVAFSFGWVADAFMMIGAAVGDGRLMPEPECSVKLINCDNGFARENNSWLLSRLVRDQEYRVSEETRTDNKPAGSTGEVSLLIDIFRAEQIDVRDIKPSTMWKCCWPIIVVQWAIACIPLKLNHNWPSS